jgi:hypothetical protein
MRSSLDGNSMSGSRSKDPSSILNLKHRPLYWLALLIVVSVAFQFYHLSHLSMDGTSSTIYNGIPQPYPSPVKTTSKVQLLAPPVVDDGKSFGACLIIMDDNHFLTEWLAYHYHTLPLKRLIVAIDPRSSTSPTSILDRYRSRGLMNITEWHETDFMPPHLLGRHAKLSHDDQEGLLQLYVFRQIHFYNKCMAVLEMENRTWTAMIDTDEYILPNPFADSKFRLQSTENRTIYDLLQANPTIHPMMNNGCVSMHRLQFGYQESKASQVQQLVPEGWSGMDYLTTRFRYHAGVTNKKANKMAKCMIDLSSLNGDTLAFHPDNINAHMPLKTKCRSTWFRIENKESPFVTYHYSGSWEQWDYRNDFRPKRKRESFAGLRFNINEYQDDSIRPWLGEFVGRNGHELAHHLLKGAGRLEPKVVNHTVFRMTESVRMPLGANV